MPFRLQVGEVVGVEVVVCDSDEGVEVVGEGCGWWEGDSGVGKEARSFVLDCEEGVERVGDGDQVVGRHDEGWDCNGHITSPHQTIALGAIHKSDTTIGDSIVVVPWVGWCLVALLR